MIRLAVPGTPAFAAPRSVSSSIARQGATLLAASIFVAICAHASVPLPFTPVPVVLSDFAVILVGLLLGPSMGFAALALYLVEGAAGLPVFSPLGMGGLAQLLGPTAGYLFAYPLAAALAGALRLALQRVLGGVVATAVAATAAALLILLSGAAWISRASWISAAFGPVHGSHPGTALALKLAVLPFLLGSLLKVATAVAVTTSADHLRKA